MNMLQRIESWGDAHHPKWLSVLRIGLGGFLGWVGVLFVENRDALTTMINENPALTTLSFFLAHYIVFAHIVGGLFMAAGLYTRLAAAANIPILLGAVFFVHSRTGLFNVYPMLGLSILVLFLLIFFLIEGSGPISVDEYMRRHPEKKDRDRYAP
ncbi:DoxX family protein [Chitinophaga vietnamensis]|uniref:DoxX family protein n=1 Tax=Chitinophaga vietnamensis TaxID=2593957 RepID=UPI0011773AC4|nr:DoxX family protein [Chitinophaga vietnamensis]